MGPFILDSFCKLFAIVIYLGLIFQLPGEF